MPLNNRNALFAPKADPREKSELKTETEDLRATTLAFVLGLRGNTNQTVPTLFGEGDAPQYNGHNVGFQPAIMPGMPGTERFQQLCSIEYLQAYFYNVLAGKAVALDAGMVNPGDLAKAAGIDGSEAAGADDVYQGIFARDFGPFLKGKGGKTGLVTCTPNNLPYTETVGTTTKRTNPSAVSRNLGDDTAFERLEDALAQAGLTDWRPDGIVLSKGINDPSDQLSNEYLEARDGQLYNIRIQGPAVGTAWTGERSLEVLPLDKVFVVIVADVWFDAKSATKYDASVEPDANGKGARSSTVTIADLMRQGLETTDDVRDYHVLRTKYMKEELDEEAFGAKQKAAFQGADENTVLANFRVMVSTSSQMINHSTFKSKGNKTSDVYGKRRKLTGGSRMSLTLANDVGEYIVGGWQIGAVMDTAASRGSMPQGASLGIRSAANSAAMNINVNVSWFSADRLCRSFNNPEGTIKQRFEASQSQPKNVVNMHLDQKAFDEAAGAAASSGPPTDA